jgi:hypothetical protein
MHCIGHCITPGTALQRVPRSFAFCAKGREHFIPDADTDPEPSNSKNLESLSSELVILSAESLP